MLTEPNLRCPYCRHSGSLAFAPDINQIRQAVCAHCGRSLAVYEGVPDFAPRVPLVDPDLRPIQKLNNSILFARLYESALWRGGLTHLGAGMSMQREVQEVLGVVKAVSPEAIADLACGTGHYARAFSAAFREARVYAMDISMGMLGHGKKKAARGAGDSILFLRGDIYDIPLGDRSQDVVNCCGALHLFSDLKPIWAEISRILKPGGVFCGWTLVALPHRAERIFQERLMRRQKATFFHPESMADELGRVGLQTFRWIKRRAWLVFRAVKCNG